MTALAQATQLADAFKVREGVCVCARAWGTGRCV